MSFITIKKSHIEAELLILKSKLESEGIKCYLKNEFTTQIMNYMPSFEVELQVSNIDLEKALEVLNEMNTN
ncbi:DUF2007 domain-containing protein [Lutibacter sp. TH_r2]|uniref:putative signal transducing protein n=1 Tax=Lutibacter sp. TH_r2 TaxID=3082083 RepID=UPI0029552439|nr:DUF2007 domain-containing protein [Lutibacter sp. TH_r2]MDV7185786.1 DUF2007 domain-containing protein [Lutibacter sp. TH_r2]